MAGSPAQVAAPALAGSAAEPATAPSVRARLRPVAPVPAGRPADPATLVARAFETQKAGVVRCLSQHAADVPSDTELSVRIALSAEGGVSNAAVLPDALGASAAGSCIAGVVRSMSFPALPGPVTVRVPLTARRK